MTGGDFPWIFAQTYEHLLLVHWQVPADQIRAAVPAGMALASFGGQTWIGHDVYVGTRAHVRGLPSVPGFDTRPVVTLRTIVDVGGVRGIYLLSMDAPGAFAGWFEQHLLQVRTHEANVAIVSASDRVTVDVARKNQAEIEMRGSYRPSGGPRSPVPGSLESFLLGGDRVFTADAAGRISVIEVRHGDWALAPADVTFDANTIPHAVGLPGPGRDVVAVTQRSQEAYAAAPRPI